MSPTRRSFLGGSISLNTHHWQFKWIQLLAVPGLLVAFYLWMYHEQLLPAGACTADGFFDCGRVSGPNSPYATVGDSTLSVATLGVYGYAFIFLITWVRGWLPHSKQTDLYTAGLLLLTTGGGLAFTIYLKGLELFVIEAVCEYCLYSAVIMAALFGLSVGHFLSVRRAAD